ncbi:hypothetical protein [Mycobacterium sp. 1274761.0]|nr:hypothetical protein [Mycobacterium sp. 1274761.0]
MRIHRAVVAAGLTWDAHLAHGRWTATLHRPDAVDCRNGTSA